MKKTLFTLVMVAAVLAAGPARGDTITPFNTRPVAVGTSVDTAKPCWGSTAADCQLQTLVTYLNPGAGIDVNTGQQTAGMWSLDGAVSASVLLGFKVSGDAAATTIGLWSVTGDQITRVNIFNTTASGYESVGPTSASLVFDPITDALTISANGDTRVNAVTSFTGINPNAFGFYIADANNGNTFYSVDSLNPNGTPQMLAFVNPASDLWTLGFEDSTYNLGDHDFQDALFQVGSIQPVPEPGSILLLGTGLLGLGGAIRRRIKK
jgi:Domain of unknown function (DUF4114)/PEP-CTERM motif